MTWLPLLITGGLLILPKNARTKNKASGRSGSGTDSSTGASVPSNRSGQYNRYIRSSRNCSRCIMDR